MTISVENSQQKIPKEAIPTGQSEKTFADYVPKMPTEDHRAADLIASIEGAAYPEDGGRRDEARLLEAQDALIEIDSQKILMALDHANPSFLKSMRTELQERIGIIRNLFFGGKLFIQKDMELTVEEIFRSNRIMLTRANSVHRTPPSQRPNFGEPEREYRPGTRGAAPTVNKEFSTFTWEPSQADAHFLLRLVNEPLAPEMIEQVMLALGERPNNTRSFKLSPLEKSLRLGLRVEEKTKGGDSEGYTLFFLPRFTGEKKPDVAHTAFMSKPNNDPDILVVCDSGKWETYSAEDLDEGKKPVLRKPVGYFYGQNTQHRVVIKPVGKIIYDYPKMINGGWDVTAHPDGKVTVNEATYPYLFWEMEHQSGNNSDEQFSKGFCVEGKAVREFLEEKLSTMGFSQNEKTDFITYWYPVLHSEKNVLIRFMIDDECDKYASVAIEPKPKSLKRIYMVYRPVSEQINVQAQDIQSLVRQLDSEYFEWGGMRV